MELSDIDLNQLVLFQQLMVERSVSKVAEKLGLTQPAVSNTLAKLRRQFGDDLFVRTPTGMMPTPFAEQLAEPIGYALGMIHSGLNQHSYNLQPVTESMADQRRFVDYMTRHHASIPLKKDGHYAKLPGWARANVQNDNHAAIARHVEAALKVFVGASRSGTAP